MRAVAALVSTFAIISANDYFTPHARLGVWHGAVLYCAISVLFVVLERLEDSDD